MRTRGWYIFFIIVAAGALLLVLFGGRRRTAGRKSPAPSVAAAATPLELSPLPRRPLSPQLVRLRERVMRAAATTRELDWQTTPGMIELTGWEYGTRTKEM